MLSLTAAADTRGICTVEMADLRITANRCNAMSRKDGLFDRGWTMVKCCVCGYWSPMTSRASHYCAICTDV